MTSLRFWIALLFLFAGAMLLWFASGLSESRSGSSIAVVDDDAHSEKLPSLPAGELLTDFELQDQNGATFASTSLAGKVWVGSVFFSSCPSTCRVQNMRVAELQKAFGDQGVEFVSVTCDPEKDTVATLASYSKMFDADSDRWHFLTGDFPLIRRIGVEKFGIVVQKETHSDRLILFDRDGSKVGSYRSTQSEDFGLLKDEISKLISVKDQPASMSGTETESDPKAEVASELQSS
jgi:cytochrome oxidase Cu insertion factor (SCO1/SenC/PrrC family)